MKQIILKTKEVSGFFGVTDKTLSEWRKAGCPQIRRGTWDLKEVFTWWWDNLASDRAAARSGDKSLNEAKRLYWWSKAEGEKLKNQREAGELIDASEVERDAFEAGRAIKHQCLAIADRTSSLVAAEQDPFKCKQILIQEVNFILEGLSDTLMVKAQERE